MGEHSCVKFGDFFLRYCAEK